MGSVLKASAPQIKTFWGQVPAVTKETCRNGQVRETSGGQRAPCPPWRIRHRPPRARNAPVLRRAAVLVRAVIRRLLEELFDEVAIRAMHPNTINTGTLDGVPHYRSFASASGLARRALRDPGRRIIQLYVLGNFRFHQRTRGRSWWCVNLDAILQRPLPCSTDARAEKARDGQIHNPKTCRRHISNLIRSLDYAIGC